MPIPLHLSNKLVTQEEAIYLEPMVLVDRFFETRVPVTTT